MPIQKQESSSSTVPVKFFNNFLRTVLKSLCANSTCTSSWSQYLSTFFLGYGLHFLFLRMSSKFLLYTEYCDTCRDSGVSYVPLRSVKFCSSRSPSYRSCGVQQPKSLSSFCFLLLCLLGLLKSPVHKHGSIVRRVYYLGRVYMHIYGLTPSTEVSS